MKENLLEPFFEAIMFAIIAELKSRKLLHMYSNAGIDVSRYEPDLYKVVFPLVGIKTEVQFENARDWYDDQIERIVDVEITDTDKINEIAGEIIIGLLERRKKIKP